MKYNFNYIKDVYSHYSSLDKVIVDINNPDNKITDYTDIVSNVKKVVNKLQTRYEQLGMKSGVLGDLKTKFNNLKTSKPENITQNIEFATKAIATFKDRFEDELLDYITNNVVAENELEEIAKFATKDTLKKAIEDRIKAKPKTLAEVVNKLDEATLEEIEVFLNDFSDKKFDINDKKTVQIQDPIVAYKLNEKYKELTGKDHVNFEKYGADKIAETINDLETLIKYQPDLANYQNELLVIAALLNIDLKKAETQEVEVNPEENPPVVDEDVVVEEQIVDEAPVLSSTIAAAKIDSLLAEVEKEIAVLNEKKDKLAQQGKFLPLRDSIQLQALTTRSIELRELQFQASLNERMRDKKLESVYEDIEEKKEAVAQAEEHLATRRSRLGKWASARKLNKLNEELAELRSKYATIQTEQRRSIEVKLDKKYDSNRLNTVKATFSETKAEMKRMMEDLKNKTGRMTGRAIQASDEVSDLFDLNNGALVTGVVK